MYVWGSSKVILLVK